jgi:hypothetical protein
MYWLVDFATLRRQRFSKNELEKFRQLRYENQILGKTKTWFLKSDG